MYSALTPNWKVKLRCEQTAMVIVRILNSTEHLLLESVAPDVFYGATCC